MPMHYLTMQIKATKAMPLFNRMRTPPSTVTYQFLVQACSGSDDLVMEVFSDCVERGLLDERLIDTFLSHSPPAPV